MVKYKICRQIGIDLFRMPKLKKYNKIYGYKKIKKSKLYFKLLRQQKIIKTFYGLKSKQLQNIFRLNYKNAFLKRNPIINLETRLDIFLTRLHWFSTITAARQFILHGKVLVNGSRVLFYNYLLKPGDLVQVAQAECLNLQESLMKTYVRRSKRYLYWMSLRRRKSLRLINKNAKIVLKHNALQETIKNLFVKKYKNQSDSKNRFLVTKSAFSNKLKSLRNGALLNKILHVPKYVFVNFNIMTAVFLKVPLLNQIPFSVKTNPYNIKRLYQLI